jgi:hypothetical protein
MCTMRETEASGWMVRNSSGALTRALRLAVVTLGVGLVMATGVARAQDDEDDKTFEESLIEGVMRGLGGTNMDNRGIEYRERSPLVVPPRLDLPPPASVTEVKTPNWPKDPDEARRKAAIAARKKAVTRPAQDYYRPLLPSELNVAKGAPPASSASADSATPGNSNNPMLSPSQLGFDGKFSNLFGGAKPETAPFKGEPTRESLTQPPAGYQTPSPNYAYGTGPAPPANANPYNPVAGQYGDKK